MDEFVGNAEQFDDLTMVCVENKRRKEPFIISAKYSIIFCKRKRVLLAASTGGEIYGTAGS